MILALGLVGCSRRYRNAHLQGGLCVHEHECQGLGKSDDLGIGETIAQ